MAIQRIMITGAPYSGKTTLSLKIAKYIEKNLKKTVIVVFAQDKGSPTTYAFYEMQEEGQSLGALISTPEITEEDIKETLFIPKGTKDIGILGYCKNESFYDHPEIIDGHSSQLKNLFMALERMADYIIIDGTSDYENNSITGYGIDNFDTTIYVSRADVCSLSYYRSDMPLLKGVVGRPLDAVILNDINAFSGVDVIEERMSDLDYVLPYEVQVFEQSLQGQMIEEITAKKRRQNFGYMINEICQNILIQ